MPVKVLIVDDALFMRNLVREIFSLPGAKGKFEVVAEAGNGQEAVDLFQKFQPDMVLMDVVMPLKNGIEATRDILKINPDAKVIMCSALGQESLVVEAIDVGAEEYIVKPFQPEEALKVIETVMGM